MTVEFVNTDTGEVMQSVTVREAKQITERIRLALDRVASSWADLGERIAEAYEKRVDLALGYGSWAEYAEAELKPEHGIAAEIRRELVGMLSAQGMTSRSIAPTVGVSDSRVRQIVREVGSDYPPAPNAPTAEPVERPTPSVVDVAETGPATPAAPRPVVGLDGKTYSRPAPSAPKRRPLADQAHDAAANLTAALERVERIFADDRFTQNREQVGEVTRAHLLRTAQVCQHLAEQLPS